MVSFVEKVLLKEILVDALGRRLGEYKPVAVLERDVLVRVQEAYKALGLFGSGLQNSQVKAEPTTDCELAVTGVQHDVDDDGTVDLTTSFYACPCNVELPNTVAAGPCTGIKNNDLEIGLGVGLGVPALALVAVVLARKLQRSRGEKMRIYG